MDACVWVVILASRSGESGTDVSGDKTQTLYQAWTQKGYVEELMEW